MLQTLNLVVLDPDLCFEAERRVLQRLDLCAGESPSEWSQWLGLNQRPTVYETVALPLSYIGVQRRGKLAIRTKQWQANSANFNSLAVCSRDRYISFCRAESTLRDGT